MKPDSLLLTDHAVSTSGAAATRLRALAIATVYAAIIVEV
jgi:hypothetical protein